MWGTMGYLLWLAWGNVSMCGKALLQLKGAERVFMLRICCALCSVCDLS
jgi:hypothetical protein